MAYLPVGCGSGAQQKPKQAGVAPSAAVQSGKTDAGNLGSARAGSAGSDARASGGTAGASGDGGTGGGAANAAGSEAAGTGAGTTSAGGAGASGAAGTAPAAACQLGQFKCVNDTIYKCNDARTDFIIDTTLKAACGAGLCNAQLGRCNVCMPRSVECTEDGSAVRSCSDDGQLTTSRACDAASPICVAGICGECRMDSDPSKTGCAAGNDCVPSADQLTCQSSSGASKGLNVEFCHAGACKVALAPGFDLALNADWSACTGSAAQAPFAASSLGVMLWPTALTDLAIPLANTGWFCKLPPANGARNSCIVNASQSARELYIWGTIEAGCTYAWGSTPSGIDATLGPGCGNCSLEKHASDDSADYAFNMGLDTSCRCPKVHLAAIPAKKAM